MTQPRKSTKNRVAFRALKRRSSVENFGQFGFLTPALALVPVADGVSRALPTQNFDFCVGRNIEHWII